MPESRGRKQKSRPPRTPPPRSKPSGIDLRMMEPMQAADRAEARGDALGALEIIAAHPRDSYGNVFWRPRRGAPPPARGLLKPFLPPWVTSRWLLAQAGQALLPELRDGHRR